MMVVCPLCRTGTFPTRPLSVSSLGAVCNNSLETANWKCVSLTTFLGCLGNGAEPAGAEVPPSSRLASSSLDAMKLLAQLAHPAPSTPWLRGVHTATHTFLSELKHYLFSFLSPRSCILGQAAGKKGKSIFMAVVSFSSVYQDEGTAGNHETLAHHRGRRCCVC